MDSEFKFPPGPWTEAANADLIAAGPRALDLLQRVLYETRPTGWVQESLHYDIECFLRELARGQA